MKTESPVYSEHTPNKADTKEVTARLSHSHFQQIKGKKSHHFSLYFTSENNHNRLLTSCADDFTPAPKGFLYLSCTALKITAFAPILRLSPNPVFPISNTSGSHNCLLAISYYYPLIFTSCKRKIKRKYTNPSD